MSSLGWKLIRSFERAFLIEGQQVTIKFNTMNCVHKQLYQVYAPFEGKIVRFHMQINTEGVFKIMGHNVCPPL